MEPLEVKRPYNATARRARAANQQQLVIREARHLFLERGFAAATIAAIAEAAGVSPETVYKRFGGKAGLVRAIWHDALAGEGDTPAEQRSDAMAAQARTGSAIIEGWMRLSLEVAPRSGPVLDLVRAAAASNSDAAELLREIDRGREERMLANAQRLAAAGFLRPDLTVTQARDILLVFSDAFHAPLVVRGGWDTDSYIQTTVRAMSAALLR